MKDLIERQDAIDAVHKEFDGCLVWDESGKTTANAVEEILDCVPSAQPEIIRCKDCKWYGRVDKRRFYRGMDCMQKRIDTIIPDKDFCSRAERREA